jgi:CSN8/PSMD8/EIF3K family
MSSLRGTPSWIRRIGLHLLCGISFQAHALSQGHCSTYTTIFQARDAFVVQAYSKLLLKDAAQILRFDKQQELLAYCKAQGWRTDAQHVYFAETVPPDHGKAHLDVFKNMLTYARELDRII